jgi:hypothetical protein
VETDPGRQLFFRRYDPDQVHGFGIAISADLSAHTPERLRFSARHGRRVNDLRQRDLHEHVSICYRGPRCGSDQTRISVDLPNKLSIRSTAISAVRLRTSSAGFSSITSSDARRPVSAIISMHSCASR